jgi:single-strand DNA-binding protein
MNTLRNSVKLIGHLGQDPEIRTVDKGGKLARFTMATTEAYNDKDGKRVEQTQWHSLVAWGPLAERCEKYLKKGKEVAVEGRLQYNTWEDKTGVKHTTAEINVSELLFLGSKKTNEE